MATPTTKPEPLEQVLLSPQIAVNGTKPLTDEVLRATLTEQRFSGDIAETVDSSAQPPIVPASGSDTSNTDGQDSGISIALASCIAVAGAAAVGLLAFMFIYKFRRQRNGQARSASSGPPKRTSSLMHHNLVRDLEARIQANTTAPHMQQQSMHNLASNEGAGAWGVHPHAQNYWGQGPAATSYAPPDTRPDSAASTPVVETMHFANPRAVPVALSLLSGPSQRSSPLGDGRNQRRMSDGSITPAKDPNAPLEGNNNVIWDVYDERAARPMSMPLDESALEVFQAGMHAMNLQDDQGRLHTLSRIAPYNGSSILEEENDDTPLSEELDRLMTITKAAKRSNEGKS
jgi:hypothetical protein